MVIEDNDEGPDWTWND